MGCAEAQALGMVALPIVTVSHPVGGLKPEAIQTKADTVVEMVIQAATQAPTPPHAARAKAVEHGLASQRISIPESIEEANAFFLEQGWGDGLPLIPPTEERVERMVAACRRDPQQLVAVLPPAWAEATLEKVAVNAVMAGCLPQYLPVVLAAVEAMAEERFNLYGIQATTHPCGPLLIVNGPKSRGLGIASGYGAFGPGPGHRANASIGRAIRLVLLNIGGARPGMLDRSTQGQPSKYSYCVAENESASPWAPLHVELGFAPEVSTVTVLAAENPHNINDHESTTARGVLTTVAGTAAAVGSNNATYMTGEVMIALGPEHAATVAADGFSKQDVKSFIFDHARVPIARLSRENILKRRTNPRHFGAFHDDDEVPIVKSKDDIMVIVVGGAGKHSSFIPTFGMTHYVTRAIT